ncbi:MAG TPA: GntG family PLP-dependent aldolase [Bryobacteraceae bacterium]|nr:low specificity L-threonine aldolase [Bryobacterales bacterium]HRJ19381.1 GntG family PLP-dependent aldolase [Bryobacteraceae bacterium]
MPLIDLRSDTVTKPTPAMRRAMFEAEVGDDVYQEDPTVNRLEARAAEVLGKEAALFVPSGCMGNTIGIKLLTRHGEEVIAEARGHLLNYELSMAAWFSGCLVRPVAAPDGILTWDLIAPQVRPRGPHWAATGCIELENTHNMAGGTVYPQDVFDDVCDRAHAHGLPVHLDGARLFNAAAALGRPVSELCAKADTVMVCLSKGLGAPVGSMLAGPAALMDDARLYRKRLGGGMRQAGILAAAGLIALEQMPARMAEDHANARFLAEGLGALPGVRVLNPEPATNIVVFEAPEPARLSADLKARGVLINPISETALRAVTHYDVTREDCAQALAAVQEVVTPCRSH